MNLTKNKKYQYLFFFIIFIYSIFNGGNSNIVIQVNFIFVSLLFFLCIKDKNYYQHLNKFFKENKLSIFFYFLFLIYLLFQIIPIPIENLKFFSIQKFNILNQLNLNISYSSISLSPSNSFFQLINFITLFTFVLIIKMIFYTERHKFRFYIFLSFLGAFSSFVAVLLYLKGNPDLFFIKNSFYKDSSTGFFINRTVFSLFLLFCLVGSLQYLKIYNNENNKNNNKIFFKKIYVRIFVIFICIGIITSSSRIGNFFLLLTLFYYLIQSYFINNQQNTSFRNIVFLILFFDILIVGYYFGTDQLIQRFLFLNEEFLISKIEHQNLSRLQIINFGLENIKKFYLFGYGPGSFETLFQIDYPNTEENFANHAHSSLIQFIGEFGFLGFTLLILSIFKFFWHKIFFDKLNILLLVFLFVLLSFDFSLHIPLIQILFIIFFILNKKIE
jgi:hypothetical protein